MNVKTKVGVVFQEFNGPIVKLLKVLFDLGDLFDQSLTITSANDGKHMDNSFHYKNLAWDIRTRDLNKDKVDRLMLELKMRLGAGFQIILEEDHIHVEYDNR